MRKFVTEFGKKCGVSDYKFYLYFYINFIIIVIIKRILNLTYLLSLITPHKFYAFG
jgi:hypothetical protein